MGEKFFSERKDSHWDKSFLGVKRFLKCEDHIKHKEKILTYT